MGKVKNVSKQDVHVPALGGRLVVKGAVVEVPDEAVYGFTCQTTNWAPADAATKKVHDAAHELELIANFGPPEDEDEPTEKTAPKKENG